MRRRGLGLAVLALVAQLGVPLPARAVPALDALPVITRPGAVNSKLARYPRITIPGDPAVTKKINAVLAQAEAADRQAIKDNCGGRESVRVAYLSAHYLSLRIDSENENCGQHPNEYHDGLTLDLATGDPVAWAKIFKPDFYSVNQADDTHEYSGLFKVYAAAMKAAHSKKLECVPDDMDANLFDGFTMLLFQQGARSGLLVTPVLPASGTYCQEPVLVPFSAVLPAVTDAALRAEIQSLSPETGQP